MIPKQFCFNILLLLFSLTLPKGQSIEIQKCDDNGYVDRYDSITDVLVLVCTQSFTGEDLVEDILLDRLWDENSAWDIKVDLVDVAGIDWTESDKQQQKEMLSLVSHARAVLVVASTYGDGDPPNHATEFADWLARSSSPHSHGDDVHVIEPHNFTAIVPNFAVFGLGDSSYAHYCAFSKYIDASMAARGGNRLLPLHMGDKLADQSGEFRIWANRVSEELHKVLPSRTTIRTPMDDRVPAVRKTLFKSTGFDWRRSAIQADSVGARFEGSVELLEEQQEQDASRSVLHVSIQVRSDLYPDGLQPGDHLGIYPRNEKELVERALAWLGVDAGMETTIVEQQGDSWLERKITAFEFLTVHVDLAGRATPSALRALLPFAGTLELRALAKELTQVDTKEDAVSSRNNDAAFHNQQQSAFDQWVAGRFMTKMELAELFECRPSLQAFARTIGPMQPRLYSIATVKPTITDEWTNIGLCIAVADKGLCSNFVAHLDHGSDITVFFRKSRFHFDVADVAPSLMIATGSGIGPYIGFFDSKTEHAPSNVANTSLFFGCRTPGEILYKNRLSMFQSLGANIQYAFSRLFGQPKIYAQDLLKKESDLVWEDVFEKKGKVFICGKLEVCDASKRILADIAVQNGGLDEDEAVQLIEKMEETGRILTDCWSVESTPQLTEGEWRQLPVDSMDHSSQELRNEEPSHPEVDLSEIPAWPSYLRLVASGEFERRVENATRMFSSCVACGRFCEVDRLSENPGDWGECRIGNKVIVSAVDAHFGEEPCLKGTHGSGTIFLGACNLKCIYCQNHHISAMDQGELVDDDRLADMMLMLQEWGCHNINFVSPTHNVLPILRGVLAAAKRGLRLPIVWNTGGYDSVASLRLLEGIVDIYLPDAKYASRAVARKLSKVDNYPEINQAAIKEMHRQVGDLQIDPRTGLAYRGVLIRHLILPSDYAGTQDVAAFLANEVSVNTYSHVMNYYRPEHEARFDRKYGLDRKPTEKELHDAHARARFAGLQRLL